MNATQLWAGLAGFFAVSAQAADGISPRQTQAMKAVMASYAKQAEIEFERRRDAPKLQFSAEDGRSMYLSPRPWQQHDRTCSSCHTKDPRNEGLHAETKKAIKPLAPVANPERFTDAAKMEKNFKEHCVDLYERDCRAMEKGNFIAYMMSLK